MFVCFVCLIFKSQLPQHLHAYPGVECSRMRARDLENRTDFLRNALL